MRGVTDEETTFWDDRYRARTPSAELTPNPAVLAATEGRPPGRVLELGCGHGDTSVLLATRGWSALAVDLSEVALARVAARAAEHEVADRVQVERHDLARSMPAGGPFDLVVACFFQSPFALPRGEVLRGAAALVRPGGLLLDVTHGAPPPWAGPDAHEHVFQGPQEVWKELALDPAAWTAERLEAVTRPATGPDGQKGELLDTVVLARRGA